MKTLYLCAAGNPEGVRLALSVNRATGQWDRIVLLDDDPAKQGRSVLGVEIIGPFDELRNSQAGDEAVNLVARTTEGRRKARAKILSYGVPIASLVHPSVDLFGVTVGREVTIYADCTVSAESTVGDEAVIFGRAMLGHGARLGVGAVLAPGAVINARVRVGDFAYIGSNASVLPDLRVGDHATVGAVSAVVVDVADECTVLGVPAEVVIGPKETRPAPSDRRAEPASSRLVYGAEDLEEVVRLVFQEVLNLPSVVGLDDNFFDLGGSSVLVLSVRSRLEEALGRPVTALEVFTYPTVRRLAAYLSPRSSASSAADLGSRRAALRRNRRLGNAPVELS